MKQYPIKALHFSERFQIKDLREKFAFPAKEMTGSELVLEVSEESYIFVFSFGAVVFFNVPEEIQENELQFVKELKNPEYKTSDWYEIEIDESVKVCKISFEKIFLGTFSFPKIKIAALLLAQSTTLEHYELIVEDLLSQMSKYTTELKVKGKQIGKNKELIQFIGQCLSVQQEVINNLYIVDAPDETWSDSELFQLFSELKSMLEIQERYKALEYKLRIITDTIDVMIDLSKTRSATLMELIIIMLIAMEFSWSLIDRFVLGRH